MAAELDPQLVDLACQRLGDMADRLAQLSAWCDGDGPGRERAAIALEDASNAVMAAGWLLERADPPDRARVAQLVHRRMSP